METVESSPLMIANEWPLLAKCILAKRTFSKFITETAEILQFLELVYSAAEAMTGLLGVAIPLQKIANIKAASFPKSSGGQFVE